MGHRRLNVFQLVLSVVIVFVGAIGMVGHQARLPQVLTIAFGSLGTGISLGRYLELRRLGRRPSPTDVKRTQPSGPDDDPREEPANPN
jgi:hypothetical protein